MFSAKGEPNGKCTLCPMSIPTHGPPICQQAYRMPLTKWKLVEQAVDDMLADGVIRPSSSPWASPITRVPKKDGTTRFCVDYKKVNDVTEKDRYPLPLIQDIFDQLGGVTIFSTLDIKALQAIGRFPSKRRIYSKLPFGAIKDILSSRLCHLG